MTQTLIITCNECGHMFAVQKDSAYSTIARNLRVFPCSVCHKVGKFSIAAQEMSFQDISDTLPPVPEPPGTPINEED